MKSFLKKILFRSNNQNYLNKSINNLTKKTPINKIFKAITLYSSEAEIRYVGGCIRKIISRERVDDIDLATNLLPNQVCDALKKNNISYYESGIEHGTITAIIDANKFEITTLREDVYTDGRHAKVKFSKDWKKDASRRDFTINSIYSNQSGNLFDPYNGKEDLENGFVNFIGDANIRIKEDYLRILRYLRFFLNYSKQPHNLKIFKILKMNIGGISKLSKERLLDELKKIIKLDTVEKLYNDKLSLELFLMIFPEIKNIEILSKLNSNYKKILEEKDFIFLLSLMIIDNTDNADYFLYKFNISKKEQKRIKIISNFYKEKISNKSFSERSMNKVFYYFGKEAVDDILCFKMIRYRIYNKNLMQLRKLFKTRNIPKMPVGADILMTEYQISEGKQLGHKLKKIEEKWVENNFQISKLQIENIIND
mgnify:FL=1